MAAVRAYHNLGLESSTGGPWPYFQGLELGGPWIQALGFISRPWIWRGRGWGLTLGWVFYIVCSP